MRSPRQAPCEAKSREKKYSSRRPLGSNDVFGFVRASGRHRTSDQPVSGAARVENVFPRRKDGGSGWPHSPEGAWPRTGIGKSVRDVFRIVHRNVEVRDIGVIVDPDDEAELALRQPPALRAKAQTTPRIATPFIQGKATRRARR